MEYNLDNLAANIVGWAHDRNLIEGSTTQAQFVKLIEEIGELAEGIAKNRPLVVQDSIGDAFVVLAILAEQSGFDMQTCVGFAWDEIKHRKGHMENGVFIKQGD